MIRNPDGTVWTGTWVVARHQAERAARNGAYVALHLARDETSYMQGIVKDWRRSERDAEYAENQEAKTRHGVDFLLELTATALPWVGDGTGEKGYGYRDHQNDQTDG